jgi:hypothetical protein
LTNAANGYSLKLVLYLQPTEGAVAMRASAYVVRSDIIRVEVARSEHEQKLVIFTKDTTQWPTERSIRILRTDLHQRLGLGLEDMHVSMQECTGKKINVLLVISLGRVPYPKALDRKRDVEREVQSHRTFEREMHARPHKGLRQQEELVADLAAA